MKGKARPIIVTRPDGPGRVLTDALRAAGADAVWWPAFELGPASDESHARATMHTLDAFDLAVFVSPAAVEHAMRYRTALWPASTTIAVVGEATRRAVESTVAGASAAPLLAPFASHEDEESVGGSEALWNALTESGCTPRNALILRADHGREWLGERLREAGAKVTVLPVYTRQPAKLDAGAIERLRIWMAASLEPALVVSSSEAIAVLHAQYVAVAGAWTWLQHGRALALHERTAQHLRAAGFTRTDVVAPRALAIVHMLGDNKQTPMP